MQVAAKPLAEVFETLADALVDLDQHGEAMAALHLAMAVDCLKQCIAEPETQVSKATRRAPKLTLVVT
ncbi:MAG: hypothetical protein ACK4Z8_06360 [Novosphingobium sp.]